MVSAVAAAFVLSSAMSTVHLDGQIPGTRETARVLAFNDDGTRALVEEHLFDDDTGGIILRYEVLDKGGRVLAVDVSNVLRAAAYGVLAERLSADECRQNAALLERAVADFRDTVRVRPFGCASQPPNRGIVEVLKTTPAPVASVEEVRALLAQSGGVGGTFFVNERGPLVVAIETVPGTYYGAVVVLRTFLREDPRIYNRWPNP